MFEILREDNPMWDERKEELFMQVDKAIFKLGDKKIGELLEGQWWKALGADGESIGYSWLKYHKDEHQLSVLVDSNSRGYNIGENLVASIERFALQNGLNYINATVEIINPEKEAVVAWFHKLGYRDEIAKEDMDKTLEFLELKGDINLIKFIHGV